MAMASTAQAGRALPRSVSTPKKAEHPRAQVVIFDREGSLGLSAARVLSLRGYKCEIRNSQRDTETAVGAHNASVVVCNARGPEFDGFDFVVSLRSLDPNV